MTESEIKEGLDRWFGHDDFRAGQYAPVEAVTNGRDAVVVMPTGAGKSLCFQLSALLLPGVTVVVSPLIALMRDQVAALERRQIPATFVNSTLDAREYDIRVQELLAGSYKLVYVAPERLANEHFAKVLARLDIAFLAVDEAHCISQWGHDFRPDYLALGALVDAHPAMRVMAVTATATPSVREDIRYAEDLLLIIECMLDADAAVAVDEAYYHYRFHGSSVTKRYSPYVPQSYDLSNDAIAALLADYPECARRMTIRRRKMAVTSVRNLCYPGTPFGFFERVRKARAYMNRADVRAWFEDVRPLRFAPKLAVRLFLMKHRMAFSMCFLFTYIFDRV